MVVDFRVLFLTFCVLTEVPEVRPILTRVSFSPVCLCFPSLCDVKVHPVTSCPGPLVATEGIKLSDVCHLVAVSGISHLAEVCM